MRSRVGGSRKRRDELGIQAQMPCVDRFAQLAGDVDIRKAPDQARVVALVDLDAVATAILGGFAGSFRGRKRVHQLAGTRIHRSQPDADGEVQPRLAVGGSQQLDALTQALRELLRVIQRHRHQNREAVPRDAPREGLRGQPGANELAQLRQHRIAHMHAEAVVDHMQLIGVDVERGPLFGLRRVRHGGAHALLEFRPCVQPGGGAVGHDAVPIERLHFELEILDRGVREQVAPQALQRGPQERVGK